MLAHCAWKPRNEVGDVGEAIEVVVIAEREARIEERVPVAELDLEHGERHGLAPAAQRHRDERSPPLRRLRAATLPRRVEERTTEGERERRWSEGATPWTRR